MTTDLTERQNTAPAEVAMERNRFTRPGFIAAAGVVGLITTAALAFVVFPSDHHKPTGSPTAGTTTGTPAAAPAARPAGDSVCGLPPGDQTVPTTAPAAKWELVGTTAAPTAPGIGPGSKSGLRSCFAHSPTGALYALVNYLALSDDPRTNAEAISRLAAKGPSRDAALAEASKGPFPLDPNARIQVAGFAYLNYSATDAVIDLVTRVASSSGGEAVFIHTPQTMRWEGGDWKFSPAPDSQNHSKPLSDMDGYVIWSGA